MGNKSVGYLNIVFGASTKSFKKSLHGLERSVKKVGKSLKRTGANLTRNLTMPIIAMGAIAIKTFATFEQAMLKVKAVSGATGAEFESLKNNAKRLGETTMFTASQVAELQFELAKLGFNTDDINNSTQAILQLSQATGHDLAESGEIVAATLNSFSMETTEAAKVADIFAVASSSAAIDMEKLSVAMPTVGATAAAVGIPLEDLTAMMMTLADRGMEASTMGTHLRKIFVELATQGISLDDAMLQINTSTNKVKTATNLFGKRAFAAGIILADNTKTTKEYGREIDKAAGKSKEMADIMDSGTSGSLRRLKSAFEGIAIDIGEMLIPMFEKLVQKLRNMMSWWKNLDQGAKDTIVTVGLVVAAIGPLTWAIGTIVTACGFLIPALTSVGAAMLSITWPVALVIAAIVGIVMAFAYVRENYDAFAERMGDWGWWKNSIIELIQFLLENNPMNIIIGGFNDLLTYFGKTAIPNPLQGMSEELELLKDDLKVYENEFGSFTDAMKNQGTELKDYFLNLLPDFDFGGGGDPEKDFVGGSAPGKFVSAPLIGPFEMPDDWLKPLEPTKSLAEMWTGFWNDWGEKIGDSIKKAKTLMSSFSELNSSVANKERMEFENDRANKNSAIDEDYNKQLTAIENTILNEENKKEAIANLDSTFDLKRQLQDEQMAKKEGALKRKQAKRDKLLGIANAIISGVEAVMGAVAFSPLTGGLPWSAIVAGLAAANVATIASTPIPSFASGGIVSGPTVGLMGEYSGAKSNPEVIAPLDRLKSLMGSDNQKVEVYGRISGNDLIILNQKAEFNRNRFV